MNISTDISHITPDYNKSFGGYEWWYFDGLSVDGNDGFVVIFYERNPFSTRYINDLEANNEAQKAYPAISVSIYKNGETAYYSFLEYSEDEFGWDESTGRLKVGKDAVQFSFGKKEFAFKIELDQELPSGHSVKGSITGKGNNPNSSLISSDSKDRHSWNLLQPRTDVEVSLQLSGRSGEEELVFEGAGYHDHNIGYEPMKESFRDWYWGRYHFQDFTLVYYLMEKHNESQFKGWLIDKKNQRVLEHFEEANLDYFTRNWFGLNSARKIELKAGQVSVNIQCNSKIDDGPFYQRFIGDSIINYNDQVYAAHGFSEYIYPDNIHSRLYWPLVHMRLRYMDKAPHWVQKSGLMYPWTW
jgi:carotenoid 1,2-hydratase